MTISTWASALARLTTLQDREWNYMALRYLMGLSLAWGSWYLRIHFGAAVEGELDFVGST